MYGLTRQEIRILRQLNTPEKIQRFIDFELAYNKEKDGETCRSPRRVLRDRTGHCFEGALLAAAALRISGHPPLVVDLEAIRDDDHIVAVFKLNGHWGAIGKSNYAGLRFREPVYRTVRELVMSYFEHYYNLDAEKTLRRYSRPLNLARFDRIHWMTAEADLWEINDYLLTIKHYPVLTPTMVRSLRKVDRRLFEAGKVGMVHS
ncbi:MAG TPA: hypothetical protein VMW38_06950 [Terriglobia bacterium]|nr:hypothetical protein [Terriglobia bacterium]